MPSHFKGDNRPVEQVSWDDCQDYCQKLTTLMNGQVTFRLPSEAEWEYACRAGTTTQFYTGDVFAALEQSGWYIDNDSGHGTHPVGELAANAWGLHDMHGNVWEWCQDGYLDYEGSDQTNPQGQTNNCLRVMRGGCWFTYAIYYGSGFRGWQERDRRENDWGFRVCFRLE
jgi:formylglycine-generating enzyme required for sulfatase activity